MELRGSVVMITGGAIRVGRQIALHMARQGASILFTYLPGEPWEEAQAQIAGVRRRCAGAADGRTRHVADPCCRRGRAGALRSYRRADQQRIGVAQSALPRNHRSAMGQRPGHQSQRAVFPGAGGGGGHAAAGRRGDHQHHGHLRIPAVGGVRAARRQQGRAGIAHEVAGR